MKRIILLIAGLALSIGIVFGLSYFEKTNGVEAIDVATEIKGSIISQNVLSYEKEEIAVNKLYYQGRLLAVVSDMDKINAFIDSEYENYKEDFPDTSLGLTDDFYIANELTYARFSDVDDKIISYLKDNHYLGIKAIEVDFSTDEGIFDIIYVKSIDDFYEARDSFLLNFISEESLASLRNGEKISDPTVINTSVDMSISIAEKIDYSDAVVYPEEIFTDVGEIYNYLCYGRNEERVYYTVQEGDTLQGVGFRFRDMRPETLKTLNPDVIKSTDQILVPGTRLNVTYFTSPLTVTVKKEKLSYELINPENPIYEEDKELEAGQTRIKVQEAKGSKNVLYEEVWINGELQSGKELSSIVTLEPVQGVIAIGSKSYYGDVGTGNFIWPIERVFITCRWGCYPGHQAIDLQNLYDYFGDVYAADSGTVIRKSYDDISGNYVIIDHNNGFKTYYGHFNVPAFVEEGQTVVRGQVIGQIGMTGFATGPHVHFEIRVNDVKVDPCIYMGC